MEKLISIYRKIGFEDYMAPFVVMFTLLYLIGVFKFMALLNSVQYGFIIYVSYLLGGVVLIYTFLRIFQAICNILGVKNIFGQFKKK